MCFISIRAGSSTGRSISSRSLQDGKSDSMKQEVMNGRRVFMMIISMII